MLFSEQRPDFDHLSDDTGIRHSLLGQLLVAFHSAFPVLRYEIFPGLNLRNGQALVSGTKRIVRLYGGVALHPAMGRDGLAFALLHETGHHLAEGARLPWNPLIACECAADYWVLNSGQQILSNSTGWSLDIHKALDELSAMIETRPNPAPHSHEEAFGVCWAIRWRDRKESILERRSIARDHTCPLNNAILGSFNQ